MRVVLEGQGVRIPNKEEVTNVDRVTIHCGREVFEISEIPLLEQMTVRNKKSMVIVPVGRKRIDIAGVHD